MPGYAVYAVFSVVSFAMNECVLVNVSAPEMSGEGPNHMVFTVLELRDPQKH